MIDKLFVYRSKCLDPYYNIATEKLLLESVEPGFRPSFCPTIEI